MSAHRLIRALLALLFCLAAVAAAPARADYDYGDIWYEGTAAGGWGVNFAQNDTTIFATFFVYDVNNKPTWFTAVMLRSSNGVYTGTVYATTGDWFGNNPYNQALNSEASVGNATFTATDINHGLFSYNVGSVLVSKTILRQTLVGLSFGGNYLGWLKATLNTSCATSGSNPYSSLEFIVTQDASPANISIAFVDTASGSTLCTMSGPAQQFGKVADIPAATYVCGTSTQNPVHISDLRQLSNGGFEFRYQTLPGYSCTETGYGSAIPQ